MNIRLRVKNLVNKYQTANPWELAECLRVDIIYLDLPLQIHGFFVRCLRRKYIALNSNLPRVAQKITLCHELGHVRLHSKHTYQLQPDTAYYSPSRVEQEANEFAIHLLAYTTDYQSDITPDLITQTLKNKQVNPRQVHSVISMLLEEPCEYIT